MKNVNKALVHMRARVHRDVDAYVRYSDESDCDGRSPENGDEQVHHAAKASTLTDLARLGRACLQLDSRRQDRRDGAGALPGD